MVIYLHTICTCKMEVKTSIAHSGMDFAGTAGKIHEEVKRGGYHAQKDKRTDLIYGIHEPGA